MVQATLALLHLLRPPRTECRIQAFYSEDTPSPTLNYCFPFDISTSLNVNPERSRRVEGSCFFDAFFYLEGNGGLDGLLPKGRSTPVVEQSQLYLNPGQYSFLTFLAFQIIPRLPFGLTPNQRLWGTAPGRFAELFPA